jgi:2-dehydro-3-deoxy-D-arabinonate dehydratase
MHILEPHVTIDELLSATSEEIPQLIRAGRGADLPLDGCEILAPIQSQEVWAAGVTYATSRAARQQEAVDGGSVYDRVYRAERPELFVKSVGWRVCGPGADIGVRVESKWDVPEPELALVANREGELIGYTIGNDVSSRSIEGANPLYLPQAKFYERSCSIGPGITLADSTSPPFNIDIRIHRNDEVVFEQTSSTSTLKRSFETQLTWLFSGLQFPNGVFLMTGTPIVPPATFTLLAGDRVVIEIDGLGVLENTVRTVGRSLSDAWPADQDPRSERLGFT